MNKLEELIKEFCPNGVEYKKINEIAVQLNGMSGVSGKWADEGNCEFIDYMNVYKNIKIDTELIKKATVKNQKQTTLEQWDILFTSASEVPNECAISSVIEKPIKRGVFLDDHLFGIRIKSEFKSEIDSVFLNYYFRSDSFRCEINKVVRGVTRFYISKTDFMSLQIPLPALPVQREIVRILDSFTLYSAELTAELTARRKQYEFYRDKLLNFNSTKIEWKTLKETCDIVDYRGKTPQKVDKGIFLVTAKNIKKGYIDYETSKEYVAKEDYVEVMHRGIPEIGDVIFTTEAPCGNVAQIDNRNVALAQRVIKYRPKNNKLNSTFLKYYLLSKNFQSVLHTKTTGGTVEGIKGSVLHQLLIPVPPIDVQERIVKVLDNFDAICSDLGIGLPAEIEKRQKQYEYYRDKLLNFKDIEEDGEKETKAKGTGKN